jgi:hypothetical protein
LRCPGVLARKQEPVARIGETGQVFLDTILIF